MSLSSEQRRRYARHLLLAEIGEAGQERLVGACVALGSLEPRVRDVARDYLARAGVAVGADAEASTAHAATDLASTSDASTARVAEGASTAMQVALAADPTSVASFAGAAPLEEAAAVCLGAFTAVEVIKSVLGVGTPGPLPRELTLANGPLPRAFP